MEDLKAYLYGAESSAHRKKNVAPFGRDIASRLVQQVEKSMDSWIQDNKVRCSGEVSDGTCSYDATKSYGDGVDGAIDSATDIAEFESVPETNLFEGL